MGKNQEDNIYHKTNINWYPGHMAKTMRQVEGDLKLVDIVIEILDARIPISSQNPEFHKLIKNKKIIIVLNKCDLADSKENQNWVKYFEKKNIPVILCNSNSGDGVNKIINKINTIIQDDRKIAEQKGRNKIARAMIIGIPNVGKSSFINRVSNKTTMQVGNKPGVTKRKQWIRLSNNIELLDTPGVLWPKIGSEEVGLNLAYTGTIKSEILDETDVAYNLVKYLIGKYRINIIDRYKLKEDVVEKIINNSEMEENEKVVEIMNYIGEKRGAISKGNNIDLEKTSRIILEDFRTGNLGSISLETTNEL